MQTKTGAEARVLFSEDTVRKERLPKSYRLPALDARLRAFRTKREATVLQKAPIRVPKVIATEGSTLVLERIHGVALKERIDHNPKRYGSLLGAMLTKLHAAEIMHGDLTTSNILVEASTDDLALIDFGLAAITKRVEDYAVDLHVFKETLFGSHPEVAEVVWTAFTSAYQNGAALERLSSVEKRGRNKAKY